MLLDWVVQLGFLEHDPQSGIYLHFPNQSRKIIASETAIHLLKEVLTEGGTNGIITNENHLHVIMESIGQGFGLSMEDNGTIENITELYRRWLLNKPKRPIPLEKDEEIFFKKIFKHFSLLFEPRGSNVDIQVQLCSRVLNILEQVIREIGNRFSKETWELLLKIMLGFTDLLLRNPVDEPNQLSTKLCPLLIKVLFQAWIRSQTKNDILWQWLANLIQHGQPHQYLPKLYQNFPQLPNGGWRHRMPVIMQWNSMCIAFSSSIARILYGGTDPTTKMDTVTLSEYDGTKTIFELEKDFIFYAWYRILHLLGDLETIPLPNNYLEAMRGINTISDFLLNINPTNFFSGKNTPKSPDGNTILHIVGPFLFEAINMYELSNSFDRGKAQAFVALSKIFTSKSRTTNFNDTYLAAFYRGIEQGIKKNNYMMAVILNNSLNLFQSEFKGVRILIPSFISAIEQVLTSEKPLEGISSKIQVLRNSCIKILGSFICLPYYFEDMKFKEKEMLSEPNKIKNYSELRIKLRDLLLNALKTEEDSNNRQLLLLTTLSFIFENIESSTLREYPDYFIKWIFSKLDSWPQNDILQGIFVISELSKTFSLIYEYNNDTPVDVVMSIVRYIEKCMTEKKGQELQENIVIKSFYCLLDWIMTENQWILENVSCFKAVLEIIEIGITGNKFTVELKEKPSTKRKTIIQSNQKESSKSYYNPTEKIKEIAYYLHMNILYQIDNFPSQYGPSSLSSLLNEKEIMEYYGLSSNHIHCYIYHHTLISVIRHPRQKGKSIQVTIILRDETGKYVWTSNLNYDSKPYILPQLDDKIRNIHESVEEEIADENFLSTLQNFLSEPEQRLQQRFLDNIIQLLSIEQKLLVQNKYGLNVDVSIYRPEPFDYDEENDLTVGRLILAHLGILSVENYEDLFEVQKFNDPDHKFNYLQNFNVLDKSRERQVFTVGVIYVEKGQDDIGIFENESGSKDYHDFLQKLGWIVNINEHKGFLGGLDPKITGPISPYWASFVMFQVTTLMPNVDSKQIHKSRLINNNRVLISWVEDIDSYKPPSESTYNFNIVIYPLPSKLFLIKLLVRISESDQFTYVGPLLDNLVVSKHILPFLVRETCINANKFLNEDKSKPFTIRKLLIEDFIQRHKVEQPVHHFLAAQFA